MGASTASSRSSLPSHAARVWTEGVGYPHDDYRKAPAHIAPIGEGYFKVAKTGVQNGFVAQIPRARSVSYPETFSRPPDEAAKAHHPSWRSHLHHKPLEAHLTWSNAVVCRRAHGDPAVGRVPVAQVGREGASSTHWKAWVIIRRKSCKLQPHHVRSYPAKITQLIRLVDDSSSRQGWHVRRRLGFERPCRQHRW